jgi:hypothetical protein
MFLDIVIRYDPRNFRELFENFLSIKTIGCFTTHSDDLNSQIKKKSYWKGFKLGFGSMCYLAGFWQGDEALDCLEKIQKFPRPNEKVQKPFKSQIKPRKV